jgi:hypothetical protein
VKTKKIKTMWIALLVIAVLLIILSRTKFEVKHEVKLDAPIEKVWQTVIDFEHYSQWNTQLLYLGGKIAPNEKLHLKLAVEGAAPYEFKPTVSQWKEKEVFGWLAITGIPRVFDGEHFFELTDLKNGKTLLVNREEYRGILSLVMQQLPMMKLAPQGFEKMDMELKNYIEGKR